MHDYMIRGTAAEGKVRAMAIISTRMVEEARIRHTTSATATAALGRSLTAAALLGGGLRDGQSVMLRVLGDGPIGGIIAQADAQGNVRGYALNPQADIPPKDQHKLDVGGLVGHRGMLHVTRDIGVRTPYHGSAPLVSGEIAEDLAAYFASSEQIPSVVALGVLVAPDLHVLASGGLCVQVLPGASMDVIVDLEARARQLPPITQMVVEGCTPEQVLQTALGGLEPQIAAVNSVAFQCRCSRQRVEEMLCGLGVKELEALLAQEGQAEVTCRFCGDRYVLSQSDVQALIAGLRNGQAPVM